MFLEICYLLIFKDDVVKKELILKVKFIKFKLKFVLKIFVVVCVVIDFFDDFDFDEKVKLKYYKEIEDR